MPPSHARGLRGAPARRPAPCQVALAVAAPHPHQPQPSCFLSGGSCLLGCGPGAGQLRSGRAGAQRCGDSLALPLGAGLARGRLCCRLLGPCLNSARASRGGQRTSGVHREPPFDFLQCRRAAGVCVSLRWFLPAFAGSGASGRWGGRGVGWVPVLPQLRGGREAVLGLGAGVGGLTSAVRACGSSSTRLGGLGEGPRPWVVISWRCGWGLAPRDPRGLRLGMWRVNVTFSKEEL